MLCYTQTNIERRQYVRRTYTLKDVCNAIGELEQTLDKKDKADGTNWTVADGVSGIYYMLEDIRDILKDMNKNK